MRKLPIDTSAITFTVAADPRPVTDYDTKQPKTLDGAALSSLNLVAQATDEITVISVKVAGLTGKFSVGDAVRVIGLTALPWVSDGKNGVSFSAEGVTFADAANASKAKAA